MNRMIVILATALTVAAPLRAEPVTAPAAQTGVMSDGVVRKIDMANGKITLRHGPLVNLGMSGMTMVFRAQPPTLLKGIKVGDSVKFHAEEINGTLTVTAIQAVPPVPSN